MLLATAFSATAFSALPLRDGAPSRFAVLTLHSPIYVGCSAAAQGLVPSAAPSPPLGEHLDPLISAIEAVYANVDEAAQEAYGEWCRNDEKDGVSAALSNLRGRKLVWWLDAPRPVRAVVARTLKYEVSVVGLPGGSELPPAAFPRGSIIFCQPLLGRFEVRRLRFDITDEARGLASRPIELMKRALTQGDKPYFLAGGSCHEFRTAQGVSSAFLQVALLPPTSNFPEAGGEGDGAIGWRRPPGEGTSSNTDVISGVTIGAAGIGDVLRLERPSEELREQERAMERGGLPADAPKLQQTLGERVGGLDSEMNTIVRRALASRLYPPEVLRDLGVSPVRGMLLYGPPGCGKTLLAREISRAMGAREPKIVNGPEMMSKYVGESEAFIRSLFAEAELEQASEGDESALHVIVFDEMDAFTRERGSLSGDTSGIRDSVVNQLLAKMDGVDSLDNILVIGLTNRPELMDKALLRPGRLEVHVEVPRPDSQGRQRIAAIHSRKLREAGCLSTRAAAALASGALAETTEGFSGAEIAGLLRSATSFALERYVQAAMLSGWEGGERAGGERGGGEGSTGERGLLEVRYGDLLKALREVNPSGRKDGLGRGSSAMHGPAAWLRRASREAKFRSLTDRAVRAEADALANELS